MSRTTDRRFTRDFLLVQGLAPDPASSDMLKWHLALGGDPHCWTSVNLQCRLWGSLPATTRLRDNGLDAQVACLITGAPIVSGTLDPRAIQRDLLNAYLSDGVGALAALDGAFAGVIVDERRGAFVFTDRFGLRKAFTVRTGHACYASSRAVVLGRGLGLDLDPAGVVSCTLVGHTLGKRTLFAGCDAVLPASAVALPSGAEQVYWNFAAHLAERPRDGEAEADLRERFNQAVRTLIAAQGTPALNVTGGFDTRAILSAALIAGHPLVGVTSGRLEQPTVDAVARTAAITHHYFTLQDAAPTKGATAFALLTDGEWDASGGGALLRYWQEVSQLAPAGCLHGGLGEVWRAYHYKSLWPPSSILKRDPVGYLTGRLVEQRAHCRELLTPQLRAVATQLLRDDVRSLWNLVSGADGTFAAIDGFYLIERQRGLTRIASAADLWNPAYAPFGSAIFCEAALGYLGRQNRGDTLHRAIIAGNSATLAGLPRSDGGSCGPLSTTARLESLSVDTARYLGGRALGARLRQKVRDRRAQYSPMAHVPSAALVATGLFDADAFKQVEDGRISPVGLGSVAAVAHLLTDLRDAERAIDTNSSALAAPGRWIDCPPTIAAVALHAAIC